MKYVYAMVDHNERVELESELWVIHTDCPREEFEELCGLSHMMNAEEICERDGVDYSDCWTDNEYLFKLLDVNGYRWEENWIPIVSW